MALYLDVGPEDALRVGEMYITVERKSGARARLKIIGKQDVELLRKARVAAAASPLRNPPRTDTGD